MLAYVSSDYCSRHSSKIIYFVMAQAMLLRKTNEVGHLNIVETCSMLAVFEDIN